MKYALALAGGGTRGAFEVGVWKALREMEIPISAVCGTSIGAINGALFVSDADAEQVWKDIKLSDIAEIECKSDNLLSPASLVSFFKHRNGLDISPLKNLLAAHISELKIRGSHTLYGLCTYNIERKESTEIFIDEIPQGQLLEYICASACLPIFETVRINGDRFTDGGLLNNLPVNMLIRRGFDTVLSVSIKGIGMIQDLNRCGINIIDINCTEPTVGIMDFDKQGIAQSITSGYLSCLKTFGKLRGDTFAFDAKSYDEATSAFGTEFINNLEDVAKTLDLNPYTVYSVRSLSKQILEEYRMNPHLKCLVEYISNNKNDFLHRSVDLLNKPFINANTIVYLAKHL